VSRAYQQIKEKKQKNILKMLDKLNKSDILNSYGYRLVHHTVSMKGLLKEGWH
jgi:hypothetical protein